MNKAKLSEILPERVITPPVNQLIIFNNLLTHSLCTMDSARTIQPFGGGGTGQTYLQGTLGETATKGQPMYYNSDDNCWYKAQAIDGMLSSLSVCIEGGNAGATCKLTRFATITGLTNLPHPAELFLSQTTAGEYTDQAPTAGIIAYIGSTQNTTTLDVAIGVIASEDEIQDIPLTNLTEATTKVNIENTDTILSAFGKIKKWFSSFGALAWKNSVDYSSSELSNKPTLGSLAAKSKADWNSDIDNKPTLGSLAAKNSVDWNTTEITNKPTISKRLAVQKSASFLSSADSLVCFCYKPNGSILYISGGNGYAFNIDSKFKFGSRTFYTIANAWIGIYLPQIDKYHIITKQSTQIHVINGTSLALESPITIDAQTSTNRANFQYLGNYQYYTSGSAGSVLNQRNINTGVIVQKSISNLAGFYAFSQSGVNYIAISLGHNLQIYNESLNPISNSVSLTYNYTNKISFDYLNNKLVMTSFNYTVNNPPNNGSAIIDTTDILNITAVEYDVVGHGVKLLTDKIIIDQGSQNLTNGAMYDFTIAFYDYNFNILDSKNLFGYNNYCNQTLDYDNSSQTILALTSNTTAPWNSMMYFLKLVS